MTTNFKTIAFALITLTSSLVASATVKPTIPALMSYSTLVATATINFIEEPYVNQKVISLNIIDVLDGSLSDPNVTLTVLDNTVINKGVYDFHEFQSDGIERVYFLKYSNGEYSLSDSWFGIEQATPALLGLIENNRIKIKFTKKLK